MDFNLETMTDEQLLVVAKVVRDASVMVAKEMDYRGIEWENSFD